MLARFHRLLAVRPSRAALERGASAVEYSLICFAVAAVIAGVVFAFGGVISNQFTRTSNCLTSAGAGPAYPDCPSRQAPPP